MGAAAGAAVEAMGPGGAPALRGEGGAIVCQREVEGIEGVWEWEVRGCVRGCMRARLRVCKRMVCVPPWEGVVDFGGGRGGISGRVGRGGRRVRDLGEVDGSVVETDLDAGGVGRGLDGVVHHPQGIYRGWG